MIFLSKFVVVVFRKFLIGKLICCWVRNFRKEKQLGFKDVLTLQLTNSDEPLAFESAIVRLGLLEGMEYQNRVETQRGGAFRVDKVSFFIPLDEAVDLEEEGSTFDAEIKYTQGFLAAVEKKLSNERFVNNAPPQVIELERKKAADAKSKIAILEKNRKAL